ncbi:MAG: SUMF1/EgtB/PvdO family nonheme iron enzyme [Anaerolineales bacterium]|nr:SUMF1/EgtB/PvdO family nonheme iron enzyme [Anaerolineales bacterium]
MQRPLRVFLCHASQDKPAVRELYQRLNAESWINPWLDEEDLLPGQDFDLEIYKATRDADAIIICLSKISVAKEGYVNKEIRRALDIAQEKSEGAIYVIPLRLDDCNPSFEQLKKLHWVDYFAPNAHEKLLKALRVRAGALKIEFPEYKKGTALEAKPMGSPDDGLDLYRFIEIPSTVEVPYPFGIGKYPVTNAQYERFLNAPDFANPVYWLEFPKFDEECQRIGDWGGQDGLNWVREELKKSKSKVLLPRHWEDKNFGKSNPNHPMVGISWYEANAYCEWLFQNWNTVSESKANPSLRPQAIRLPLEIEWQKAAGGVKPEGHYPWDEPNKATTSLKEILRRANVSESGIGHTTPVNAYPLGKSPFGVMDMCGNVWEWQANYSGQEYGGQKALALRGGSWSNIEVLARVAVRLNLRPYYRDNLIGFRVVVSLPNG